jgi:hypothetical protein
LTLLTEPQCDQQRPACGQCRRAGLECGGYERSLVFVHASGAAAASSGTPQAHYGRRSGPAAAGTAAAVAAARVDVVRGGDPASVALPNDLTRTAYTSKYLGMFWEDYLPHGRTFSVAAASMANGGWTTVAQEVYDRSMPMRLSMLANCLAAIGQRDGKQWMVEEGSKLYGRSLRELGNSLRNPAEAHSVSTLMATRMLVCFTMLFRQYGEAAAAMEWVQHNKGLLAILTARGPSAHAQGHGHAVFVDVRVPLCIEALRSRRASILNLPEWRTLPWSKYPKTPKDQLIDIFVAIPSIFEATDDLERMGEGEEKNLKRKQLLEYCWGQHRDLQAWYAKNAPIDRLDAVHEKPAGSLSLEDLALLYLMILYWAVGILLYSTMLLHGAKGVPTPAPMLRLVVKYAEHFFDPGMGKCRVEWVSFPIGLVMQYLVAGPGRHFHDADAMMTDIERLLSLQEGRAVDAWIRSMQRDSEMSIPIPNATPTGDGKTAMVLAGAWPFFEWQQIPLTHHSQSAISIRQQQPTPVPSSPGLSERRLSIRQPSPTQPQQALTPSSSDGSCQDI